MRPSVAAAPWAAPRSAGRSGRAGLWVAALLTLFVASQYLAGYFLLWMVARDPRAATPLTIASYAYYLGARPSVRVRVLRAEALSGALVLLGAAAFLLPKPRKLHGEARFARRREIAAAGLFAAEGIILGEYGRRYLTLGGQQGVALAAPPRAGKGVGVVIPNALNWSGSLVCIDIKRENWTQTAGYRNCCGQACLLFDPFAEDGRTARWNPFHYVSADPVKRVNDLQRIAGMLYPDPLAGDPFWTASARSLFLGIALYLFETPSLPATIGEVLRQGMASDDEGFGHHWKRLIEGRNSGKLALSAECVRALYDVIDLAPVTASSIRKTFTSRLDLWLNPILDAATSGNDFDLRELRSKPLSIYVGVNPEDLHRLRPVLSLFFQQAIGLQTRELPEHNPKLRFQVLMLLDEFTALGRIPIIAESIAYLPGYNVRVLLVIQAMAQLREVYGPHVAETMLKSLAARILFAPKEISDAREISDELGMTTVKARSYSSPQFDLFDQKGGRRRTVTVSEQRRPLRLPQEVKELPAGEALIFCEGVRPIRCRKIRYFEDERFRTRLHPPPERSPPVAIVPQPIKTPVAARRGQPGVGARSSAPEYRMREPAAEDVERIDSIGLEDLNLDLNRVLIPEKAAGERLSNTELAGAVSAFRSALLPE